MRKPPRAKLVSKTASETVWEVRWKTGKTYFARLSADGENLLVETGAKRQSASELVTAKLSPSIRAAITVVQSKAG